MSTATGHPGRAQYDGAERWTGRHPLAATATVIVLTILCGALLGLAMSAFASGPGQADVHRGGGSHAGRGAGAAVQQTQTAALSASAGHTERAAAAADGAGEPRRSPARGGFAVGRSTGTYHGPDAALPQGSED
jgi:hypothetical protein